MSFFNFKLPSQSSPLNHTEEIDHFSDETIAQGIRFIYQNIPKISTSMVIIPITVTAIMWGKVDTSLLVCWLVFAFGVSLYRYVLAIRYFHINPPIEEHIKWGRYFTYSSVAAGFSYGAAAYFFLIPDSIAIQLFILVLILGIANGSAFVTSHWLESYYVFMIITLGITALCLLLHLGSEYKGIAVLMLINILLALVIGKKNNQSVLTTIQLRFENADLVKKLKNSVDEANEANARKTRFLASASHDLRQPVHALGLFSDALGNEKLSSTGKQTLSFLKQSVSSLSGLLESLLDVSRLDAGIVSPSMNAIDVSQLINNISIDTKPLCLAKGLELRVHCKSCWAYSDSVLLENILRNLLSNAIRYTEHGGILLSCRQRHDEIWIEVWDTGIGISDVDQRQIFDEFYQVNNAKRDREQGLGLGLAIVQKQTVLLDHGLSLASRVGKGSRFRLKLKVASPQDNKQAVNGFVSPSLKQFCILVIDDDKIILEGMRITLEAWGHDVYTVTNLEDAIITCKQSEPDIIISDFRLHDQITGIDVIQILRKQLDTNTPALLITGDTAPDRLQQAQKSDLLLLHKPVQPGKLRAALNLL